MKKHFWRNFFAALLPLAVITLLLLFYQSARDADETKIFNVSVFARTPGDRFMKGIEQAALDYNVDLHFFSSYAKGDGAQQIEYLRRELDSGADAVVIDAEDGDALSEYLESQRSHPPVVTLGTKLPSDRQSIHVGADDHSIGEKLAERVVAGGAAGCLILSPAGGRGAGDAHSGRLAGLTGTLAEAGVPYAIKYVSPADGFAANGLTADDLAVSGMTADGLAASKNAPFSAVAVTDESLVIPACESAPDGARIYGVGYISSFRQYLESGRLKEIVVYSEYDAGYLSLQAAVKAADKKAPFASPDRQAPAGAGLALYTASADNMYAAPLVNILFPIG